MGRYREHGEPPRDRLRAGQRAGGAPDARAARRRRLRVHTDPGRRQRQRRHRRVLGGEASGGGESRRITTNSSSHSLGSEPPATELQASLPSGVTDIDPDRGHGHLLLLPFFLLFGALALLAARFELVAGVGVFAALSCAFSPKRMTLRWRWRFIAIAITLAGAPSPVMLMQGVTQMNRLADRIEKEGPAFLDVAQLSGLYVLSRLFTLGGRLAGYPEAAAEHDGLHAKGAALRPMKNGAFPSKSPRVQAVVREWKKSLKGSKPVAFGPKLVTFDYAKDDLRWALALNPIELRATATPKGGGAWKLDVEGRVRVFYPKGATAPLGVAVGGQPLVFRETLFWALQERGWLRPYTAVWRWSS